jgi:hypothetical protein
MDWHQLSNYRIETPEGYIITRSRVNEKSVVYIARAPRVSPIIYAGRNVDEAKAACERHLSEQPKKGSGPTW